MHSRTLSVMPDGLHRFSGRNNGLRHTMKALGIFSRSGSILDSDTLESKNRRHYMWDNSERSPSHSETLQRCDASRGQVCAKLLRARTKRTGVVCSRITCSWFDSPCEMPTGPTWRPDFGPAVPCAPRSWGRAVLACGRRGSTLLQSHRVFPHMSISSSCRMW